MCMRESLRRVELAASSRAGARAVVGEGDGPRAPPVVERRRGPQEDLAVLGLVPALTAGHPHGALHLLGELIAKLGLDLGADVEERDLVALHRGERLDRVASLRLVFVV